jgi:2-dehydropantoate 2-reductase
MSNQRILVIGSGAVASLYGGLLQKAGADVSVVARSDFEVIKEKGISVTSHWGDFVFKPNKVLRNVNEYVEKPDYILVATKVLPDIDVSSIINNVVYPNTSIVLLQNGIHIEDKIVADFPNNEIISALAFVCVTRTAPGVVIHRDYGRVELGVYPKGESAKARLLQDLFNSIDIPCEAKEVVLYSRWKKLVWNAPFNPISVIECGATTDKMLGHMPTRELVINVMKEVCVLAEADGYPLKPDIIEKNIYSTEKMQPYKTSMLVDYEAGRPMEVEAILGNALRFAKSKCISVPYIEGLYSMLSFINQR